jgi:hypothetical protein
MVGLVDEARSLGMNRSVQLIKEKWCSKDA